MSSDPVVSIIVVAYNSQDTLARCLESLAHDVRVGLAEVIVVDNASPDESANLVAAHFPWAKLIRSPTNRLFAGGCNVGLQHASGRYIYFFNPDAEMVCGGLAALVSWMDARPRLGACSGEVVDEAGGRQGTARRYPTIWRSLLELTRVHKALPAGRRADLMLGSYWPGGTHMDVDWVPGAALLVRRDVLETVGSFREDLPMYAEDADLCWRIRRAGWLVGVNADVVVTHVGGHSSGSTWSKSEVDDRTLRGIYAAARVRSGAARTFLLQLVDLAAMAAEAADPRRSGPSRCRSRQLAAAQIRVLRRRGPSLVGGTEPQLRRTEVPPANLPGRVLRRGPHKPG